MNLLAVNFNNDIVDIIKDENLLTIATKDSGIIQNQNLYVSVTKVCKNLGMNKDQTRTQKEKIKKDSSFFSKEFSVSTSKGDREALCIPLNKLNGWLFSISHNKVRADIREKLIEYKNECFDVLYNHFMQVEATQPLLIDGKDPLAVIRGYQSQLAQHIKKIELLNSTIDELIAENATLSLPAPKVDLEPYKKENKRLNDELNKMTESKEHFETQSFNLFMAIKKYKQAPKLIKSIMGKYLDYPEVYNELEKAVLELERVA